MYTSRTVTLLLSTILQFDRWSAVSLQRYIFKHAISKVQNVVWECTDTLKIIGKASKLKPNLLGESTIH